MNVTRIDSLTLPGLEPYRTMRRPVEHREKGIFVAEGEKVVRRLVRSKLNIVSILMTEDWLAKYSRILENREIEEAVLVADKSLLEEIVGYGLHQGIMAIGRVPVPPDIFGMYKAPGGPHLFVALDGIANSENMGGIIRNCAAFGVDALIIGETSCDPYLRRSVRNSMGTIFQLPVAKSDNLVETIQRLRTELGFKIFAAHPQPGSVAASECDLTGSTCFIFGSEGEGISPRVLGACESRLRIPMKNDVDSINVATSVGVVLYEAVRQKTE
ncbi:MAG: RNA methyltransferase [Bacteroidetes bacterium]|nr:RNA methyltransferase [Bacteroidota bacterium]